MGGIFMRGQTKFDFFKEETKSDIVKFRMLPSEKDELQKKAGYYDLEINKSVVPNRQKIVLETAFANKLISKGYSIIRSLLIGIINSLVVKLILSS